MFYSTEVLHRMKGLFAPAMKVERDIPGVFGRCGQDRGSVCFSWHSLLLYSAAGVVLCILIYPLLGATDLAG